MLMLVMVGLSSAQVMFLEVSVCLRVGMLLNGIMIVVLDGGMGVLMLLCCGIILLFLSVVNVLLIVLW